MGVEREHPVPAVGGVVLDGQVEFHVLPRLLGDDGNLPLTDLVPTPNRGIVGFTGQAHPQEAPEYFVWRRRGERVQDPTVLLKVQISVVDVFQDRPERDLFGVRIIPNRGE